LNLAEIAKGFVNHGRGPGEKYTHSFIGGNFRMDNLQAAILRIKLRKLPAQTDNRRALAARYNSLLKDIPGLIYPVIDGQSEDAFHLFVIHIEDREGIKSQLLEKGVSAGVHYPIALHLQKAYSFLGLGEGSFPVAEYNTSHCLSLPLWPEMTEEAQDQVVETLKTLLSERR
jgi:dTDP-4-amino-4,6-dideoxygalactose transaminase